MQFQIPYGSGYQTLNLSEKQKIELIESELGNLKAEKDAGTLVKSAMHSPIGSKTLKELAAGKEKVVIVISDHTRPVPSKYLIPPILQEIREGNPNAAITLLVATGCHRGTTMEELKQKLGSEICVRENIVVHDCDQSPMTNLGILPSGAELIVNSLVAEADLVISEGFIEPHFFAGFSGGRKSILPGICSRKTVLGNHCSAFIRDPKASTGNLTGNPINRDMEAAVRMAKLSYILNVVIDEEKKIVAAFAGDPLRAHHTGCEFLSRYGRVKINQKADIVITSNGGAPLDQNLYQAVKGMTAAEQAAAKGGIIIMCAECADGIGGDAFYQAVKNCESPEALRKEIEMVPMDETVPDQWQYQILVRILAKHRVIFVTKPELKEIVKDMKMEYASSLEEAYSIAENQIGTDASVTVIPNGISVICTN